jgi:uncharacterized repeat protein (TIGR01451 family)
MEAATRVLRSTDELAGGVSAGLDVSISVTPAVILAGSYASYTITVTNPGTSRANGVHVTLILPEFMDLLGSATDSIMATWGACFLDGVRVVRCRPYGAIEPGAAFTIAIRELQTGCGHYTGWVTVSRYEEGVVWLDMPLSFDVLVAGDVNCSGSVDPVDALCIKRALVGLPGVPACPVPPPYCDVNGDGACDVKDALCLERALVGLSATIVCPLDPLEILPIHSMPTNGSGSVRVAGPARGDGRGSTSRPTGDGSATVRVDAPASAAPSAEVITRVVTGGPVRPGAWSVDFSYDPAVLTVLRCTSANGVCNAAYGRGEVRLTGSSAEGLAEGAVLGEIVFRAVGAAGASTALAVQVTTFTDTAGVPLDVAVTDGRLTVTGGAPRATATATPSVTGPRGTATPTATPPCPRGCAGATASPTPTPIATPCATGCAGRTGR